MRSFSVWLFFVVGLTFAAPTADAHAKLIQSSPVAASVVDKSPTELRLKFNEPVAAALSRVALTTKKGDAIATGPVSANPGDDSELVVSLKDALPTGTYHVEWHVVSVDMHKVQGDFVFEVRP